MKLGTEPRYFDSTGAYKIFGSNGNPVVAKKLKDDDETTQEGKHIIIRENYGIDRDLSPTGNCDRDGVGEALRPHNFMNLQASIGGMVTSYSHSTAESIQLRNETVLCPDRDVMQTEMPDNVVCLKNSIDVVKDICMDEGVPSVDKGKEDHSRVIDLLYSDLNEDCVRDGVQSMDGLNNFDTKSRSANKSDGEDGEHCSPKVSLQKFHGGDDTMTEILDGAFEKKLVHRNLVSIENTKLVNESLRTFSPKWQLFSTGTDQRLDSQGKSMRSIEGGRNTNDETKKYANSLSEEVMAQQPLLVLDPNLEEQCYDSSGFAAIEQQQSDHGHVSTPMDCASARSIDAYETTKSAASIVSLATEISLDRDKPKDLSFDRLVDNGSITFDFNSSLSTMNARTESAKNADSQQPTRISIASRLEDGGPDSLNGSTRGFFIQNGYGELDFSGMTSVSGPTVAHSGSIPFSGSTSLRSESSAASARSFAFPILHTEWNSSPVKMVRADRRGLKKRRWIQNFCCKF